MAGCGGQSQTGGCSTLQYAADLELGRTLQDCSGQELPTAGAAVGRSWPERPRRPQATHGWG